jgi:MFS family permease
MDNSLCSSMNLGFSFSFGRFQDYYSTVPPFAGSSNIAVIGVLSQGLIFICLPITMHLARRKPQWARWFASAGLLGAFLSNIASSFCTSIPQLIGTQGILLGICGSIAFCPLLVFADQWFDKRKGLAFGIIGSGAGFGGLILPLIINALLENVGFSNTMRIWASILFGIGMPLAYFVRPRLLLPVTAKKPFWNLRAVRSRFFLLNQLASLIQGAGYYLPGIYLPTFTRQVFGTSTWLSTLSLLLLNLSAMVGLIIMGHFTDRWNSRTCIIISASGAAISVFLFWGLAVHLAIVYIFCISFGLFSGCFPAVWPAIMRETARRGETLGFGHVDTLMVYSLLCVGRGIGNIISGPLSEVLVDGMPWKGQVLGGFGSGFGALIVFSGLTSLLSGMNTLWYHLL